MTWLLLFFLLTAFGLSWAGIVYGLFSDRFKLIGWSVVVLVLSAAGLIVLGLAVFASALNELSRSLS